MSMIAKSGLSRLKKKASEQAASPVDENVKGDSSTDNRLTIAAALAKSRAFEFSAGTFKTSGGFVVNGGIKSITGRGDAEIVQTGITGGSPLFYIGNSTPNGTSHPAYPGTVATFGGALTNTTKTVNVSSAAEFAVGDDVLLLLGQDPYDPDQHYVRMWNVIESISGNDVTFRIPIVEPVSGSFVAGAVSAHRMFKPDNRVEGVEVGGLRIRQEDGFTPDNSIFLIRARNMRVRDIFMPEVKSAMVIGECENTEVSNVYIRRSVNLGGIGGSTGNGFSIYGSRNVTARNFTMLEVDAAPVYIENQCRGVTLEDFIIQCGPNKNTNPIIFIGGGSRAVVLKRFTLHKQSAGPIIALSAIQGAEYQTEDFRILGAVNEFPLKNHSGFIEYKGVKYSNLKRWTRRIVLTKNMNNRNFTLPSGLYKSFKARIKSKTGIGNITLNNASTAGMTLKVGEFDYLPEENTFASLTTDQYTTIGADFLFNEDATGKYINVNTDGTTPDGNYLDIEIQTFTTDDDGVSGAIEGENQTGSASWNPGAIPDGAAVTTTVSVPGAKIGDPVSVGFDGIWQAYVDQRIQLSAYVWNEGIVSVVLRNSSGSIQTPNAGTVRVVVHQ